MLGKWPLLLLMVLQAQPLAPASLLMPRASFPICPLNLMFSLFSNPALKSDCLRR